VTGELSGCDLYPHDADHSWCGRAIDKVFKVRATGLLAMHGITRSVTADITARYSGSVLEEAGSIPLPFQTGTFKRRACYKTTASWNSYSLCTNDVGHRRLGRCRKRFADLRGGQCQWQRLCAA
jgi:hypothetical protein